MTSLEMKLGGIVVPMITPCTAEAALDEDAAESHVDRLAERGLGVFVLGTTGEAASTPDPMRRRLVEIAVRTSAGRVPVFAGIGDNCVATSIEAARGYHRLGVDAVVAHLPGYYSLAPSEMESYFRLLNRRFEGPLIVYNIPLATSMSIPVELINRLADEPNIVGLKDSENDWHRMERVASLARRPDFSVFMGVSTLSVEAMKRGFDGLVPSSANLAPDLWQSLGEAVSRERWDDARELQKQADQVAQLFQSGRTLGQSLAALKAAMAQKQYCAPHVLPPLQALSDPERERIRRQMDGLNLLQSSSAR